MGRTEPAGDVDALPPPLVPHENFVADPVDLPSVVPASRAFREARAEVLTHGHRRRRVEGRHHRPAVTLVADIGAAGEGVVRAAEPGPRRAQPLGPAATLVRPGRMTPPGWSSRTGGSASSPDRSSSRSRSTRGG